jgi:predicted secreted hydrolase
MAPAGAAGEAEFQVVRPGRLFQFPQDHGAHPQFKTEWWYYSGHLQGPQGEVFGYQLTFFRVGLRQPDLEARSAWALHTVYFAHLALTDPARGTFLFQEKAGRGALGLDGAAVGGLKVWVGGWQAQMEGEAQHLQAETPELGLDLYLTPEKPPVAHGDGGYSRKAAGGTVASYYYSLPRLPTRGQLRLGEQVLPVRGRSWLDREFSSAQMAPEQQGWDWFALQLADGWDLMLYLMRRQDGTMDPASSGTLIDPQGAARHLRREDFAIKGIGSWKSPHSGAEYPSGWQVSLPGLGYHLTLTPTLKDQEVRAQAAGRVTYWEGQVRVEGTKGEQPLSGQGYVELTGYAGAMGGWF